MAHNLAWKLATLVQMLVQMLDPKKELVPKLETQLWVSLLESGLEVACVDNLVLQL